MPLTSSQLPGAIRYATLHATLVVVNDTVRELGKRAAKRMDRLDLTFIVETETKLRSEK